MEKIVAQRFAPFNFSTILGFPNVVPSPDEWGNYFSIFREHEEDNPTQHICEFHELMHQWEIHHEDVLLKMFMFSLAGDARKWYHSLPPTSIFSLVEFHAAFTAYYQEFYPSELIFHNYCEGYHNYIQDRVASDVGYEDDPDDLDQKSVLSHPHSSASKEGYESDGCQEEEDSSGRVMELIRSITSRLDRWEAEQCAKDFPPFQEDALSSSTEGDYEKRFPTGPVYGHYEYDPWEILEEEILPDMIVSDGGCDDEGCKDGSLEEEDALSELMEQERSLTAHNARLESEDNGEDFPVLEADVLGSSFEEVIEDFIASLASSPNEPIVSFLKEESIMEEDCSLFLHDISHDVFTFGIELKDQEIVPFLQYWGVFCSPIFDDHSSKEQTTEPYPVFTKEKYQEKIIHPIPSKGVEQHEEEQRFLTGPVYGHYESDPRESQEEEPKEQFAFCPELVSEATFLEKGVVS
jgi:hypothetical protein